MALQFVFIIGDLVTCKNNIEGLLQLQMQLARLRKKKQNKHKKLHQHQQLTWNGRQAVHSISYSSINNKINKLIKTYSTWQKKIINNQINKILFMRK